MTRPLVMKFGGTSVADATAMSQVCRIIGDAVSGGAPVVVVVSAMSGVTDALLAACLAARDGDLRSVENGIGGVRSRHWSVVRQLFQHEGDAQLLAELAHEIDDVRAVLTSVGVLHELTPRGTDRVAAAGELMSSRIVAALLNRRGIRARWIDPRRTVVTDARFGAASPLPVTRDAVGHTIGPALDAGDVAVLGGFVGASPDGITTTLGRGGSDYSAAIIGAALDASEIQIWTDVDGMLTADPRVIPGA